MTMKRRAPSPLFSVIGLFVRLWVVGVPAVTALGQGDLDTSSTADIEVVGTGVVYGKPDTATATLGMDVTAPTLTEALKQATDGSSKLVAAIKAQGVDDADIQTSSYNMYPTTVHSPDGQTTTITGYQVTYLYSVKVRQIDSVGKVIDAAVAAGANSVNGIVFTIDDPSKLETEARVAAVKDAQARADTLATTAGVKIGRIISIVEQNNGVQPVFRAMGGMMSAMPAGAPIEAGQNAISVSVEMHFEILQ
jgi:uncharacterized protein YggE